MLIRNFGSCIDYRCPVCRAPIVNPVETFFIYSSVVSMILFIDPLLVGMEEVMFPKYYEQVPSRICLKVHSGVTIVTTNFQVFPNAILQKIDMTSAYV